MPARSLERFPDLESFILPKAEGRAGLPFVGPAGRILDQTLERAGIDRQAG